MGKRNPKNLKHSTLIPLTVQKEKPKTVKELIKLLQTRSKLSEDDILGQVLELQSQGKLTFKENPKPPQTSPEA